MENVYIFFYLLHFRQVDNMFQHRVGALFETVELTFDSIESVVLLSNDKIWRCIGSWFFCRRSMNWNDDTFRIILNCIAYVQKPYI